MLPGIAAVPLGRTPNIPAITGVSPSDGHSATVTVNGTADAGAAITLYRGGTGVGTTTANQSTGAWSVAGVTLSAGDNSLTATAAFGARVSAASVSFNARYVATGSQSYTTPVWLEGSLKFTVPLYNTLTVTVDGGGGGGSTGGGEGAQGSWSGGDGGQSKFASSTPVIADGGTAGSTWAVYNDGWSSGANNGNPGAATGGDTNTTGGGAAGGSANGNGGPGGRSIKTWALGAPGAPVPGAQINILVGAGGGGQGNGTAGLVGKVQVSWS